MIVLPNGSPRPAFTARDFNSIRAELAAYIAQTRPDLSADFSADQGLGPFLVDIVALVGDITSFAVDSAALAVFLDTTLQYDAALSFARSVGYVTRSATSSTVSVTGALPLSLTTAGGTIVAGQSIAGPAGTSFYLSNAVAITSGDTTVTFSLTEGVPYTDTFDTTNLPRFFVRTDQGNVADGSWRVYVGDPTNSGNLWTQVDNVSLETTASNTYEVRFDGLNRLTIQFGDGTSGQIPGSAVTVKYQTSHGTAGNIPMLGLIGTVVATVTGPGTTVVLNVANLTTAASGGADRETIDEMRINIPAFIRSSGKLTTIKDFDAAPLHVAGVAQSLATPDFASYRGNVVDVNIWESEPVSFTAEGLSPVNRSIVPYMRYKVATDALKTAVRNYLVDRTAVTVFPQVLTPGVAWADLYITSLVYDPRFSGPVVHAAVTAAVVGIFESSGGFSLRISDIYNTVRAVAGVRFFTLDRIVFDRLVGSGMSREDHRQGGPDDWPPGAYVPGTPFVGSSAWQDGGIPAYLPMVDLTIDVDRYSRLYYSEAYVYNHEIVYDSSSVATPQVINLRRLVVNVTPAAS